MKKVALQMVFMEFFIPAEKIKTCTKETYEIVPIHSGSCIFLRDWLPGIWRYSGNISHLKTTY